MTPDLPSWPDEGRGLAEWCPVHNLLHTLGTDCPYCLEDALREGAEWDELTALAEGRL